jgi:CotH kinase protein
MAVTAQPVSLQVSTNSASVTLLTDGVTTQSLSALAVTIPASSTPVGLTLQGLPPGVTASPAFITSTAGTSASFTLKASAGAAGGTAFTTSIGATVASFPVTVLAVAGTTQSSTPITLNLTIDNSAYTPTVTDLPVMQITTVDGAPIVSTDDYLNGTVTVTPQAGSNDTVYSGTMEIKGHGNTTWAMPKKPYKFKLDNKSPLLGMASEANWVLLANFDDKSLLRTQVAFELGRRVGLPWTPNTRYVELYLNGEYEGNYQLTEEIKINKNRVNITEMDPTDISGDAVTGGYLLEVDTEGQPDDILFPVSGVTFDLHDPDPAAPEQLGYLQNYLQQASDALYSTNFTDTATGYTNYLDTESFIDWYLVEELTKNNDAVFWSSCWLYKDKDGKIFMGPLWDFDIAAGNVDFNGNDSPTGWWLRENPLPYPQWQERLFDDPAFAAAVAARWKVLKATQFDTIPTYIDQNAAALQQSQQNNFARWSILNQYVWPNPEVAGTYRGEVSYLKSWLTQRIAWMDSQLDPPQAPADAHRNR